VGDRGVDASGACTVTVGSTVVREGWGSFRGRRVTVSDSSDAATIRVTADADLLDGYDPVPLDATYLSSRSPLAIATVPTAAVTHVAMTETLTRPASEISDADAGVFAVVAGAAVPLAGATGFLSDGVPNVRLEWVGQTPPAGFDWTRHGSAWFADVARASVDAVEVRTVTAAWRGATVRVARVDGRQVLVWADSGGIPFDAPEISATDNSSAGWSAVVDVDELDPVRVVIRRVPLSPAHFPWAIAEIDGPWESVGLTEVDDVVRPGLVGLVRGFDEPGRGMSLYPLRTSRSSRMQWRRYLPAHDVGRPVRVTTEVSVDGDWKVVKRINADSWKVFDTNGEEVPFDTIEAFRYTAMHADLTETPHVATRQSYLAAIGI
jgi:hypothetical protein